MRHPKHPVSYLPRILRVSARVFCSLKARRCSPTSRVRTLRMSDAELDAILDKYERKRRGEPEPSKDPNQNADGPSATSKPEPDPDDESLPLTFGCFSFDCFGD